VHAVVNFCIFDFEVAEKAGENNTDELHEKGVEKTSGSDIIETSNEEEGIEVHSVCKIDKEKFKYISKDIITDEVIITDERIGHIIQRRGEDFYKNIALNLQRYWKNRIIFLPIRRIRH
jgi:hypothetical protein